MKKITIIGVVLCSLFFLGYKVIDLIVIKTAIEKKREQLPVIRFLDSNGTIFTNGDLNPEFPTLIIYFLPNCDFCEHEIADLKTNYNILTRVNVLLVTSVSKEKLKEFMVENELGNYENFHFLTTSSKNFFQLFGSQVTPSNFVYDKNQKLAKYFKGETQTSTLLKYLTNAEPCPSQ